MNNHPVLRAPGFVYRNQELYCERVPLTALAENFGTPLYALEATPGDRVRLRFSLWRDRLPIDALPVEGWIELQLLPDEELRAAAY